MQGALGHAVETHHQFVTASVRSPMGLDGGGQCVDVTRVVVVAVDEAKLRHGAGARRPAVDRVKQAGRGGGGILRVGRQQQHAVDAVCLEDVELRRNRGAAVTHRPAHQNLLAAPQQHLLQQRRLLFGPEFQR